MKVVVVKEDLKLNNGEEDIRPQAGDVVDLPDEIAEAEIAAGFVQRVTGLDEDEEAPPKKSKKKGKKRRAVEEEDDEDE